MFICVHVPLIITIASDTKMQNNLPVNCNICQSTCFANDFFFSFTVINAVVFKRGDSANRERICKCCFKKQF